MIQARQAYTGREAESKALRGGPSPALDREVPWSYTVRMPAPAAVAFERLFRRARGRLRLRRALGTVLTGLSFGSLASAGAVFATWALARPEPAAWAAILPAALGVALGLFAALRARWSDEEVALFLDARLQSEEAITSALAVSKESTDRAEALRQRAIHVLEGASQPATRSRLFRPMHALTVAGGAGIVLFSLLPAPRAELPTPAPKGLELIRKGDVPGLDRIEALERAESLSDADAIRLRNLASDAKELRKDLARGLERREAQARIGRLREEIEAERQRFAETSERPALEAAINALAAGEATRGAAKALEEGDVVSFDEEMQRLANREEAAARNQARQALEEALREARQKRGKHLSSLLERQQKAFAEREAGARALRELSELLEKKLSPEEREALREFEQEGDSDAARRLGEGLEKAIAELTEAERKRLAEALQRRLERGGSATPIDPKKLEELAQRLSGEAGQEALREALKQLAEQPTPDVNRDRALDEAERGGAEAERGLMPVPLSGSQPQSRSNGSDSASRGQASRDSGSSSGNGSGRGGGNRERPEQPAEPSQAAPGPAELRAKADTRLLPGVPLETRALGRAPARGGETAEQLGTGALGSAGPKEVSAVENSDVPEEYREQVGRYFQP